MILNLKGKVNNLSLKTKTSIALLACAIFLTVVIVKCFGIIATTAKADSDLKVMIAPLNTNSLVTINHTDNQDVSYILNDLSYSSSTETTETTTVKNKAASESADYDQIAVSDEQAKAYDAAVEAAEKAEAERVAAEEAAKAAAEAEAARIAAEEAAKYQATLVDNPNMVISLTNGELDLLERLVQCEAGGEDIVGKILVANVVINRVNNGRFANTVEGVITASGQFSPVSSGAIYSCSVSSETKEAVARALAGEDYSEGALYFMASGWCNRNAGSSWLNSLTKVVEHGGHYFFVA